MHIIKSFFSLLFVLLCVYAINTYANAKQENSCKPFLFIYSADEIAPLKKLNSSLYITKNDLQRWDKMAVNAVIANKLTAYQHARMFTYLYAAQEEAANLSCMVKGGYLGNLNSINQKVLKLFIPSIKLSSEPSDEYSEKLADIVFAKIEKRVQDENNSKNEFIVKNENKNEFSSGLDVAKWSPWFAAPAKDFWPAPPPAPDSPRWKTDVAVIKAEQAKLTAENKNTVNRWAGIPDRWSDDWRSIANEYFFSHHIALSKLLKARTTLTIALYDCSAAVLTMKYHYQDIRPKIYDPTVVYLIEVPKHPTYPAGHAAEGACAATVLSHFFPNSKKEWQRLADEEALSRVWAGVHYPVDIEGGKECGKKVADKVLSSIASGQNASS